MNGIEDVDFICLRSEGLLFYCLRFRIYDFVQIVLRKRSDADVLEVQHAGLNPTELESQGVAGFRVHGLECRV